MYTLDRFHCSAFINHQIDSAVSLAAYSVICKKVGEIRMSMLLMLPLLSYPNIDVLLLRVLDYMYEDFYQ